MTEAIKKFVISSEAYYKYLIKRREEVLRQMELIEHKINCDHVYGRTDLGEFQHLKEELSGLDSRINSQKEILAKKNKAG